MYLELSPRGSGKSWRLAQAINEFLRENPYKVVAIIAPTMRGGRFVMEQTCLEENKEKIESGQIDIFTEEPRGFNGKCFYDDFISNQNLREVNYDGYYCSSIDTPINIFSLDRKYVFLSKLLKANSFGYMSYFPYPYYDKKLITTESDKPAFKSQYLNQIFTV